MQHLKMHNKKNRFWSSGWRDQKDQTPTASKSLCCFASQGQGVSAFHTILGESESLSAWDLARVTHFYPVSLFICWLPFICLLRVKQTTTCENVRHKTKPGVSDRNCDKTWNRKWIPISWFQVSSSAAPPPSGIWARDLLGTWELYQEDYICLW